MLVPVRKDSVCDMCDARGVTSGFSIEERETWLCALCDVMARRFERQPTEPIWIVVGHPGSTPQTRRVWDDRALFDRIVGGDPTVTINAVVTGRVQRDLMIVCREQDAGSWRSGTFVVCELGPDDHGLTAEEATTIVADLTVI
jgi:hypothetical protein